MYFNLLEKEKENGAWFEENGFLLMYLLEKEKFYKGTDIIPD